MPPARPSPDEMMVTERRRDVLLLLENMARREDATIRLILDCLYDIGSTYIINERVRSRPLNRTLKRLGRTSKPVFRELGTHWFHKNCPALITDWLYSQATFQPPNLPTTVKASIVVETQAVSPGDGAIMPLSGVISDRIQIEQAMEIARLRKRIQRLRRYLVWSVAIAGGLGAWVGYTSLQVNQVQDFPYESKPVTIEAILD
ncbi:MAG: hypothetical protein VKK80_01535 [Prochlorothrix sp.]|nr:hypothetical protein [Prochlorothrix sp.]